MKINITADFTKADIQKDIDAFERRVFRVVLNEREGVGLQFVTEAREKAPLVDWHRDAGDIVQATKLAGGTMSLDGSGSFNDQTGNLRSSIGFIIMYNGEIVDENFALSPRGKERHKGMSRAKAFAKQLGEEHPSGWALITVAGMEYASYVEAKGYDVISGSTLGANSRMMEVWKNVSEALKYVK